MVPGLSLARMRQMRLMAEAVEMGTSGAAGVADKRTRVAYMDKQKWVPFFSRRFPGVSQARRARAPPAASRLLARARAHPPLLSNPRTPLENTARRSKVSETLESACARLALPKPVWERARAYFAAFRDARQNVVQLNETVAACLVAAFEE